MSYVKARAAPLACRGAAVDAIEVCRRTLKLLRGVLGSLLAGSAVTPATTPAQAATLPEDKAEVLFHRYDGGGVQASGPALLVRKNVADRVSLSAQTYVDVVSNASIDVVTTASPFRETRKAWELGAQTVVRDSTLGLSVSRSTEPDYVADALGLDLTHEVFGGMTTVSLGYTRGRDQVGKAGIAGGPAQWLGQATHWQYRAGLTQIISPRWLLSANAEAIADSGYLGSPYRAARVFGAAVPERNPRTRSSTAVKLRSLADTSAWVDGSSLRVEYRAYRDNWAVRAGTTELAVGKTLPGGLLLDATLRHYSQSRALFYSDNASSETLYVSRNRQLSAFTSQSIGARLNYAVKGLPAGYEMALSGAWERKSTRFKDFTDLRSGLPYAYVANVFQAAVSATF
jgi:hypothetical protein